MRRDVRAGNWRRQEVCRVALIVIAACAARSAAHAQTPRLELRPHDRVALVGNALAERLRLDGNFETRLHLRLPQHELSIRNFGWPADEVGRQQRPNDYTKLDDPLAVFAPQVFLCFFGFNESFAGASGVAKFEEDYKKYLAGLREKFAGPRIVLVSPIAFEGSDDPLLSTGERENQNLRLYADAVKRVADAEKLPFIDLFGPTLARFTVQPGLQYTVNGAHLNDRGDQVVAMLLETALVPVPPTEVSRLLEREAAYEPLRKLVVDLEWLHQQDYRMVNGWYVYGTRSAPLDVNTFRPEYAKIRKMCAERDAAIWATAQGKPTPKIDDAQPPLVVPPTAYGTKPYSEPPTLDLLTPAEAELALHPAPGYRVETFASEEDFPDLAKPVQLSFDNKGRMWAACMPTYPQWKPGPDKPTDRLVIFEDTNGDGRADRSKVFYEGLHCPVGFEFWNGGVLVVDEPKLIWLKDTDGDDKADVREVILDGWATDDTHHAISVFEYTPTGRLLLLEGISMSTAVETPWGPFHNQNRSAAYELDPRRWTLARQLSPCYANPWCYSHNDWGQGFVGDGTMADQHWATPLSGAELPDRPGNREWIHYDGGVMRPAFGNGFIYSRHFPPTAQGNFFFACVINTNAILQFRVTDDASGYHGERIEDLVKSPDRNFRPGDPQIGPDGALYFCDWHNPLIGHMQYSQRDPNRDHTHGRIYRLYAEGRPLVKPVTQFGKSTPELLEQLREYEPTTTARVRRELRDKPTAEVVAAVKTWVAGIAADDPLLDKLRTEALWVLAGHHAVDLQLAAALLAAKTPDARAAAVHVIADEREWLPDAAEIVAPLVDDPHPRVRLEAVRALSFFPDVNSAKVALRALRQPMDEELTYTLESTLTALKPVWLEPYKQGTDLADGDAARKAFLERMSGADRGLEVAGLAEKFVKSAAGSDDRKEVTAKLLGLVGDATAGQRVFERSCRACHRIGNVGADFGPNLSDVGARLKLPEILESVMLPNAKLDPKYRATNILTVDGKMFTGLVASENDEELVLVIGQGTQQKIPKEDIDVRREVEVSSMPERIYESMSGAEFLDLLAFLPQQKTPPAPKDGGAN